MITVVQNRTRNRRPSDGYRVSRPGGCWWWVPVLERRGRVVRPRDRPSLGYSRRQPWFRRSRVRPGRGTPDPPLAILISQHSVYYLRNGRIFNGNARARPVAFGRPRHRSAREAHHRRPRTRGPLRDRPTDPWPDTRERDHPSSEFRWRPVERTRSIADRRDSPGGDRWHTGRGLEGMAHRRGGEHSRPDDSTSIASAEPRGWNARTSAPVATGPGARRVNREGGGRPTRAVSISGRPRSVGSGGWCSRRGSPRQFHPGTGLPVGSDIRTDLDSGRQPGDHPAERTGGAPVLSI